MADLSLTFVPWSRPWCTLNVVRANSRIPHLQTSSFRSYLDVPLAWIFYTAAIRERMTTKLKPKSPPIGKITPSIWSLVNVLQSAIRSDKLEAAITQDWTDWVRLHCNGGKFEKRLSAFFQSCSFPVPLREPWPSPFKHRRFWATDANRKSNFLFFGMRHRLFVVTSTYKR